MPKTKEEKVVLKRKKIGNDFCPKLENKKEERNFVQEQKEKIKLRNYLNEI